MLNHTTSHLLTLSAVAPTQGHGREGTADRREVSGGRSICGPRHDLLAGAGCVLQGGQGGRADCGWVGWTNELQNQAGVACGAGSRPLAKRSAPYLSPRPGGGGSPGDSPGSPAIRVVAGCASTIDSDGGGLVGTAIPLGHVGRKF